MTGGKGHPLPESDEARHNEIPEGAEREKGRGEEGQIVIQPLRPPVNPDGEPYRYDDLGRGPGPEPSKRRVTMIEERKGEDRSGSALQQSQSGGDSGEFGGNRDQQQSGQADHGGRQMGGGAGAADQDQAGGSSGTGGYGNAENEQQHQGQQREQFGYGNSEDGQSRGERFDEEQGGGRGGSDGGQQAGGEFERDQQQHQDRGQGDVTSGREQE